MGRSAMVALTRSRVLFVYEADFAMHQPPATIRHSPIHGGEPFRIPRTPQVAKIVPTTIEPGSGFFSFATKYSHSTGWGL